MNEYIKHYQCHILAYHNIVVEIAFGNTYYAYLYYKDKSNNFPKHTYDNDTFLGYALQIFCFDFKEFQYDELYHEAFHNINDKFHQFFLYTCDANSCRTLYKTPRYNNIKNVNDAADDVFNHLYKTKLNDDMMHQIHDKVYQLTNKYYVSNLGV